MRKLIAAAMVATIAMLVAPAANATGPQKGPFVTFAVVECSINLVSFPNPVKTTNPGNCNGLTAGLFYGFQSNGGGGLVAGLVAGGPTSITAQYTEPCVAGALGFSNGVGTVNGIVAASVSKSLTPTTGTGVATVPYSWTRVGVIALITTGKLNALVDPKKGAQSTLTFNGNTATDAVGGVGLGVLIPLGVPDETNCPGGPLTVQIAAVLTGL